jgi:hypothetical protein
MQQFKKQNWILGFTLLPLTLFSCTKKDHNAQPKYSGAAGELTWTLTANGDFTISGAGDMPNYSWINGISSMPWSDYLTEIKTVVIKTGVTSIGNSAFSACEELTKVTIPNSVTSIGKESFYQCSKLTSISIPNSVTNIGLAAFGSCGLTSITIGSGVTNIENSAFIYMPTLKNVICNAATPPMLGTDNFGVTGNVLHVPAASVSAYKSKSEWTTAFPGTNGIVAQ